MYNPSSYKKKLKKEKNVQQTKDPHQRHHKQKKLRGKDKNKVLAVRSSKQCIL